MRKSFTVLVMSLLIIICIFLTDAYASFSFYCVGCGDERELPEIDTKALKGRCARGLYLGGHEWVTRDTQCMDCGVRADTPVISGITCIKSGFLYGHNWNRYPITVIQ